MRPDCRQVALITGSGQSSSACKYPERAKGPTKIEMRVHSRLGLVLRQAAPTPSGSTALTRVRVRAIAQPHDGNLRA